MAEEDTEIVKQLKKLKEAKTNISSAIVEKGGTLPTAFVDYGDAIRELPAGAETVPDVEFMDYDGTTIASYTFSEANSLTTLPELPERDGLVNQGWNYTLQDVKEAASIGLKTLVGCTYITDDGVNRIHIKIEEPNGTFNINFTQTQSSGTRLDWGDGTWNLVGSTNKTYREHAYATPGEYTVTLSAKNNVNPPPTKLDTNICSACASDCRKIQSIDFGRVNILGTNMLRYCDSISSISMPSGVPTYANGCVDGLVGIEAFVVPRGMTSIVSTMFQNCASLKKVSIPPSVTAIDAFAFCGCGSLENIRIPKSVVSFKEHCFQDCTKLKKIYGTIKGTVEWGAFKNCGQLNDIDISVSNFESTVFYHCASLASVNPGSEITAIGTSANNEGAFEGCLNLTSVSEIVTDVIQPYAFRDCISLSALKITDANGSLSIGQNAFRNSGITLFDFSDCSIVPTLYSNAFYNHTNDMSILVPASLASNWKAASNWSSVKNYIKGV